MKHKYRVVNIYNEYVYMRPAIYGVFNVNEIHNNLLVVIDELPVRMIKV